MEQIAYGIIVGGAFSIAASYWNRTLCSPALGIANRWLRWVVFTLAAAWLTHFFGWSGRPFWVLAVTAFLLWFLLETLYNWLAISALSQSPIPLFPRFSVNNTGEEWPARQRIIKVRDWLRKNKFTQVQALLADIGNGIHLRVSIYQDPEAKVRVQVFFIPLTSTGVTVCFSVSSETENGMRYTTDNLFLPFGGYYPENWSVKRCPWTRNLSRLIRLHLRRIELDEQKLLRWETEPLNDLNDQQYDLDRLNTELGFLFPQPLREEYGKMTIEGRYRVWKEVWLLNYLGIAQRY